MDKKLFRVRKGKIFAGVCTGFSKYFDVDVTIVRLIVLLLTFFVGGGLLAYIICALVIPMEPDEADI